MAIIRSGFDRAGETYAAWFGDWLHIHFIARTILILLVLFLLIFLAAMLLRYVLAPAALMFFYHVIFRAWNFLLVETPQEWIYIKYHSRDLPNFSALYLRLCDKVKRNRLILSHTKFRGMVIRSRKFSTLLPVITAVAATLWVSAFALHHEYAEPVLAVAEIGENGFEYEPEYFEEIPAQYNEETPYYPTPDAEFFPEAWAENAVLTLNEAGREGARLRDGPGIADQTIIEILWDDAELIFRNAYVPDTYVNGLFWLRVETPDGTVGYISSHLVDTN